MEPSYEQKSFPAEQKQGKLRLIASRDGLDGSVKIIQDARLYATLLKPGEDVVRVLGAAATAGCRWRKARSN
jgi:hypothetical protein